jgi:hypothetical protein
MSSGRPQIQINWEEVDQYLIAGVAGTHIADTLGIHADTLYRRCQEIYKMNFTDYAAKKRQKGNSMLHYKQFKTAMNGNVSMLVWLGKQRLGQKEDPKSTEGFDGKLGEFLDYLKAMDKKDENKEEELCLKKQQDATLSSK